MLLSLTILSASFLLCTYFFLPFLYIPFHLLLVHILRTNNPSLEKTGDTLISDLRINRSDRFSVNTWSLICSQKAHATPEWTAQEFRWRGLDLRLPTPPRAPTQTASESSDRRISRKPMRSSHASSLTSVPCLKVISLEPTSSLPRHVFIRAPSTRCIWQPCVMPFRHIYLPPSPHVRSINVRFQ